jgi:NitT/TauT family transport system ATP-binding protein
MVTAELLSGSDYLGVSAELVERALHGTLVADAGGATLHHPRLIEFSDGAASFPWRSQAIWMARRLAARNGLDPDDADRVARGCFRPDIHRAALSPLGIDLPGASEKIEGALTERTAVASSQGTLFLGPDCFFDGRTFDCG